MYLVKGSKHAASQEYHLCSPSAQASDCLLEKLIQMRAWVGKFGQLAVWMLGRPKNEATNVYRPGKVDSQFIVPAHILFWKIPKNFIFHYIMWPSCRRP